MHPWAILLGAGEAEIPIRSARIVHGPAGLAAVRSTPTRSASEDCKTSSPRLRFLKLRYSGLNHAPVLYSVGNAAVSRRFSLAMPPGVFSRSERYFSSRPSHS